MSHTTCKICGTRPRVGGALGPGSSDLEIYCDVCGISVRDQTSTEGAWSKWEALMSTAPVYVVGQVRAIVPPVEGYDLAQPQLWELAGVFNTRDSAVSACRDRTYFVAGPITVGELAPHETAPDWWPSFYPIAPTAEDPLVPGEGEEAARLLQGTKGEAKCQGCDGLGAIEINGGCGPYWEPCPDCYVNHAERAAVPDDLAERLKTAARALIRERKVYAEDVDTMLDVLRVLESLAAAPQPPEGAQVSIGLESAARQAYAHWAEFGPTPEFGESMDHLGEALDMLDSEVINRPGYDSLWSYFGLSYASFLVLPRAFMHAMPGDWQGAMARLLRQWDSTWNWPDDMPQPIVQFRDHGGYVRTPSWLINYRHPETKTIEALRVKPRTG